MLSKKKTSENKLLADISSFLKKCIMINTITEVSNPSFVLKKSTYILKYFSNFIISNPPHSK